MKKVIDIYLSKEEDFYDCYNPNRVSKAVIEYLLQEVQPFLKGEALEIHIHNQNPKMPCRSMILERVQREYVKCMERRKRNNIVQLIYLILGLAMLLVSILIGNLILFDELFLIGGWVFIWSMIEIEITKDYENNQRQFLLKKLLEATYQVQRDVTK